MLFVFYIVCYYKIFVCNLRDFIISVKIEKYFVCLKINILCFEIFCCIILYKLKRCRDIVIICKLF